MRHTPGSPAEPDPHKRNYGGSETGDQNPELHRLESLTAEIRDATTLADPRPTRVQWADRIAQLLTEAARAELDPGALLAAAIARTGDRLGAVDTRRAAFVGGELTLQPIPPHERMYKRGLGVARLVRGRPGSWEAAMICEWGYRPLHGYAAVGHPAAPLAAAIADVLAEMALEYVPVDGGDIISLALGQTANTLGGIAALTAVSAWADEIANIGGQYADDGWERGRNG